jgi:hypothetical protein
MYLGMLTGLHPLLVDMAGKSVFVPNTGFYGALHITQVAAVILELERRARSKARTERLGETGRSPRCLPGKLHCVYVHDIRKVSMAWPSASQRKRTHARSRSGDKPLTYRKIGTLSRWRVIKPG